MASSVRLRTCLFICLTSAQACGESPAPKAVAMLDSARTRINPKAVVEPILPIVLDTAGTRVLEFWPLAVTSARQIEETRRIVEHLQADLALTEGFETATLLASGDGSMLLLVAAWRNQGAAETARASLAGWLRAEVDSGVRRRRLGTATSLVRVRRTVGTPPSLGDAAMMLFTRYALKPGHSFGALATLSDSNLAARVLRDTAAQGGATVAAADSGALYVIVQARTATALDPRLQAAGPLPFWAPFADREEQLLAVVAVVNHR